MKNKSYWKIIFFCCTSDVDPRYLALLGNPILSRTETFWKFFYYAVFSIFASLTLVGNRSFREARYGGLSIGETYHSSWTADQFNAIISFLTGNSFRNSSIGLENYVRSESVQVPLVFRFFHHVHMLL